MNDPLPSDVFTQRIRAERERQKMSQAQLVRRMAEEHEAVLDPSAITRIEQGTRAVRLDEAVAIADVLGLPLQAMIEADDPDEAQRQLRAREAELAILQKEWSRIGVEIDELTREIRTLRAGLGRTRSEISGDNGG